MAGKVVQVIQATVPIVSAQSHSAIKKRRVAGYARVSTEKEEQQNSYEAQMDYYTTYIQSNPEWIFVDVYSDEGITGTNMKKRDGFNQMIADALDGKIDLIITKSVSRFARNTVDSLTTVRKLKEKGVEVYFQKENIYTLDSKGELLIRMRHRSGRPSPHEDYPFRGMIFCGTCGKPVNIQYTTREGRQLTSAYRCISRKDSSGVEIPGLTYTPPHKSNYTKNPTDALVEYREKYCKKVLPRHLLCSDIQIPVERPQKAFVQVWNLIVAKKARYQATLKRTADVTEDVLIRYRAGEMFRLLDDLGKITEFDYPLMLRTLDRVETTPDEKLTFLFQSGIRITV